MSIKIFVGDEADNLDFEESDMTYEEIQSRLLEFIQGLGEVQVFYPFRTEPNSDDRTSRAEIKGESK